MRFWIKTYVGDKITNDAIIIRYAPLTRELFDGAIKEAVDMFDLSTPVILQQHFTHFYSFNSVKFLPRDFMESVDFDKMTVENTLD